MSSISDGLYAIILTNYEELYKQVIKLGTDFIPTENGHDADFMAKQLALGKAALLSVNTAVLNYQMAVSDCKSAIVAVNKLTIRICCELKTLDTSNEMANGFKPQIYNSIGGRKGQRNAREEKPALDVHGNKRFEFSSFLFNFDNRVKDLELFFNGLASFPNYRPADKDLKIANLAATINGLRAKRIELDDASEALNLARINRNGIFCQLQVEMEEFN